jgi:5'-deoxynucleotidase YfbR-like HD superfamily hydrolase
MPTSFNYDLRPASEEERAYLESLIREDFERCHPGETLEDLKRRASFSKEDKGLLRDWMAIAASRAAADQAKGLRLNSAA